MRRVRSQHRLRLSVLLALLLASCGARDALETGVGGVGAQDVSSSTGAGSAGGGPLDCAPAGVRICGGSFGCPPLEFEECPGVGCTPPSDIQSGEPLEMGICWPDIEDWVSERCLKCESDEVCVRYSDGDLYCVPFEVCDMLYAMAVEDACRYTDRSAFVGLPFASGLGCPAQDRVCGSDCDDCAIGEVCVGRSATNPYGLCLTNDDALGACTRSEPDCSSAEWRCLVFDVPSVDQPFADDHGICVPDHRCEPGAEAGFANCY